MKFSLVSVALGIFGLAAAIPQNPRLSARQNEGRPAPNGACCVANTNLKQDVCTAANGQAGVCVPGGNNCGSSLSCVAQSDVTCDNNVPERSGVLCRANAAGGGFFDGANVIQDLSQAEVN